MTRTHHNLVEALRRFDAVSQIDESDVAAGVIPLFRGYGMFMPMTHALWRGVTVVTLPRFDPDEFLRAVEAYRVTKACLTSEAALALARHPAVDRFDLSSLKLITTEGGQDEKTALECEWRPPIPRGASLRTGN